MREKDFSRERIIDSTINNEYAEGLNDEILWEQDLVDTEIPADDRLPDIINEDGIEEGENYDENGYTHIVP